MNIISIVFKKESVDMFRDRKVLVSSILIPLILFPLLYGFMGKGMNKENKEVIENTKIALVEQENSEFGEFLRNIENIEIVDSKDIQADLGENNIYLSLTIPENFDESINDGNQGELEILYDNTSTKSTMAYNIIQEYIRSYSDQIVTKRLDEKGIDTSILTPISIKEESLVKEEEGMGKMMLAMLLPMLLVIYCATGPLPAATDLGAGEKERGTLEPLLTTQANRFSLLWGKFFAITVMGVMTAIASLIGILIAIKQNPEMFGELGNGMALGFEPQVFVFIAIITILMTMTFGALELAISIYARSFKEAQTYLTPITMIGMFASFGSFMVDGKNIPVYFFALPVVNGSAALKQLALGIVNYTNIGITIGFMLIYVLASILFARYMFSRENVIFRT